MSVLAHPWPEAAEVPDVLIQRGRTGRTYRVIVFNGRAVRYVEALPSRYRRFDKRLVLWRVNVGEIPALMQALTRDGFVITDGFDA